MIREPLRRRRLFPVNRCFSSVRGRAGVEVGDGPVFHSLGRFGDRPQAPARPVPETLKTVENRPVPHLCTGPSPYSTKVFVDIYELIRNNARMSRSLPRPTDAELAILRVLWERGPATVRQVHAALAVARETGYTTTLKLMQIMADKGLVTRDESQRTHVYTVRLTRDETQRQLVTDLVDRAFGGSAAALVLQALSAHPASAEELAEIQKLIAEYKERATP